MLEILITPKPLGVSTISSEGMAWRRASATTSRAVSIFVGFAWGCGMSP
ncbi:hypothetical protein [Bacteroides caecimuris]|nr:hypothetical protein [Bacteroides caecimuris]